MSGKNVPRLGHALNPPGGVPVRPPTRLSPEEEALLEDWAPNKPGRRLPAVEGSEPIRSGAELFAVWGPQAAGIDSSPQQPEPPRSYARHFTQESRCEAPGCQNPNAHRFRIGSALVRACCQDHARRAAGHEETSMATETASVGARERLRRAIERRGLDLGESISKGTKEALADECGATVNTVGVYLGRLRKEREAVRELTGNGTRPAPVESRPAAGERQEEMEGQASAPPVQPEPPTTPAGLLDFPDPFSTDPPAEAPPPGENGTEAAGRERAPNRPGWQEQARRMEAVRGPTAAEASAGEPGQEPGHGPMRHRKETASLPREHRERAMKLATGDVLTGTASISPLEVRRQVLLLAADLIEAVLT